MVQNYPATTNLITLLRQAPQTQQMRSLLRSVEMVQGCLNENDSIATLRSLLQIARDRYTETVGRRGSGLGLDGIKAFQQFEKEIESIPGFGASGTARSTALESECEEEEEEEEESTRLQKAGTAAVSVLRLPFLAVGQVLGAAGGILGGVSGAVQDIGKAIGPTPAKPARKTRTQPRP
ncbi:hypothetical protein FRC00_002751 [Tulasnella sp. 408]|nr:hypothetical protein FRC00_002751 [Tulasnella sp. 408]